MGKVTDLEAIRAEKAPVCEYCGEPEHKGTFECPRIKSVKYDSDEDTVQVFFYPPGYKPVAGGG